ncbi:MAG: hypothetical protein H7836_17260 [Magnetococcus sp. YQC-3]
MAIRVSRTYDEIRGWVEWLCGDGNQVIAYQHDGDDEVERTHVHLLVCGVGITKQTMKNHLVALVGRIDKTDWSFKSTYRNSTGEVPVDRHFITYMAKGSLTPMIAHRFIPAHVEAYKSEWVSPKPKVVLEDGKFVVEGGDKEKKLTKWEMLERMRTEYTDGMSDKEVVDIIRKVLKKNHQVVGMYKILDYYDSIMMYSKPEKMVEMVTNALARRNK